MKGNNLIITIVIAIIVAAAGFFGGMQYEKAKAAPTAGSNAQFAQNGNNAQFGPRNGQRRFGNGGGATVGQIVSVDKGSITVKLQDGSSKIVNITSSTKITKTDTASTSDLKSGDSVAAFGTAGSDGSITAQNISLNPQMMRGFFGGPRPSGQPNPSQ